MSTSSWAWSHSTGVLPAPLPSLPQAAVATARDERKQLSKEAGLAADAELAHQLYECSQVRGIVGCIVCLLHWPLAADSKLSVPGAALWWAGRLRWQVCKPLLRPAGRGPAVQLLASGARAPKRCLSVLSSPAALEPPSAASLPAAPQCHATLPTSRLLELHHQQRSPVAACLTQLPLLAPRLALSAVPRNPAHQPTAGAAR